VPIVQTGADHFYVHNMDLNIFVICACAILSNSHIFHEHNNIFEEYSLNKTRNVRTCGADKSLARPTSRRILFDGENISFEASLVIYIYIYIVLIFLQL
jgi:hypothetical protein